MDAYFTNEKIEDLVTNHNWEMVPAGDGKYYLRQKDKHYMTTVDFEASEEAIQKFCVVHATQRVTKPKERFRWAER